MVSFLKLYSYFPNFAHFFGTLFLIISLFLLLYLVAYTSLPEGQKLIYRSFLIGFATIALLSYIRLLEPIFSTLSIESHPLSEIRKGLFLLLLISPIEVLLLQKRKLLFNKIESVVILYITLLVLNIATIFSSGYIPSNWFRFISYIIAISLTIFSTTQISLLVRDLKKEGKRESEKSGDIKKLPSLIKGYIFGLANLFLLLFAIAILITPTATIEKFKFGEQSKLFLVLLSLTLLFSEMEAYRRERDKIKSVMPAKLYGDVGEYTGKHRYLRERLIAYFEKEKPYLDSKLNIKKVSLILYSNKTYLSRVINDTFNANFCQFVNRYRIEEAKRLFAEDSSLSIQQLCEKSGFGSSASFTMAFRVFTGKTPADWCKEYRIKNSELNYNKV